MQDNKDSPNSAEMVAQLEAGRKGVKAKFCLRFRIASAVLRKLFKSTLNNRLHRNLACVIDKSSRDAKLKRAFEELP